MANYYSKLSTGTAGFSEMMLENSFGIVTVMNAKIYDKAEVEKTIHFNEKHAEEIIAEIEANENLHPVELKTLKIANVTVEGPTKTITGGRSASPLLKYGKTARLEMQDALGNARALEALCGSLNEYTDEKDGSILNALHYGLDFSSDKVIIGDTYFIDKKSSGQVKVKIIFYDFLPDSLFNLTQDAEGDATVFDMNGDLIQAEILVGTDGNPGHDTLHEVFYSICAEQAAVQSYFELDKSNETWVLTKIDSTVVLKADTELVTDDLEIAKNKAVLVTVEKDNKLIYSEIIANK